MRVLRTTLAAAAIALAGCVGVADPQEARDFGLTEVRDFRPESSGLRMYKYVASTAGPGAPLVVVLHHCFQNALDAFVDAGWRQAADAYGLALLLPEERPGTNGSFMCFDFAGEHARGRGEPHSIRLMIDRMVRDHGIDSARVFAAGLSGGGGMTAVMLALYPELFAGGGVFDGVAFGCAEISLGFTSCFDADSPASPAVSAQALASRVRTASGSTGPWPRLAVWTGRKDWVVDPINSLYLVRQWTALHGAAGRPPEASTVGPVRREVYRDAGGSNVVEVNTIDEIGHSVPVDLARGCGQVRDDQMFALVSDIGVCAATELMRFWGIPPRR
jgi:poly(hydroxyalkanoate) depolymerase family esterase